MKPSNKILILAVAVVSILLFWLVPGINKSKATKYTRLYEDTNVKRISDKHDATKAIASKNAASVENEKQVNRKEKKVYKTESIKADTNWKAIKPKMFSRAMQYQEELLVVDSIDNNLSADSAKSAM